MKKFVMLSAAVVVLVLTGSVFGQSPARKARTPSKRPTNVQRPPTTATQPVVVQPGNGAATTGPIKQCPEGFYRVTLEDCVRRTANPSNGTTVNQAGVTPAGTIVKQKPKTRRRPTKINGPQRPR